MYGRTRAEANQTAAAAAAAARRRSSAARAPRAAAPEGDDDDPRAAAEDGDDDDDDETDALRAAIDALRAPTAEQRAKTEACVADPDGFFDARATGAPSRAAAIAHLVWRRVTATRNHASATLRHACDDVASERDACGRADCPRAAAAGGGTGAGDCRACKPWNVSRKRHEVAKRWRARELSPALRYGSLVLANEGSNRSRSVARRAAVCASARPARPPSALRPSPTPRTRTRTLLRAAAASRKPTTR